jgi:pimeloyl-ACP methyl ester carboxylesterase
MFLSPEPAKYVDREINRENVRRYLEESEITDRMKNFKRVLLGLLIVVGAAVLGFVFWANNAAQPEDAALQALTSDAQVVVEQQDGFVTFSPAGKSPTTGFVFYPGGRVDYRAYAPVLRMIAQGGYFVAAVDVNLNLAFFEINAADVVISNHPEISQWAVGGHSLGGVAASSYAANHLDGVDGLVLWASYPADDSLTNATINVISIYGTKDMAGMEPFDRSRMQLPADTQFVVIDGGNHAQFGAYGFQAGDNPADIPANEQWTQIADATTEFLETLTEK